MKTLLKYLYFLLCMPLFFTACSDDDPESQEPEVPTDSKLEIIQGVETFSADGGTQQIEFNASHKWSVKADQLWCKVSPMSGVSGKHSVSINVSPNESFDERNSRISFKSGSAEKIITIIQKQKNALLLTTSKADVPFEGKNVSVEVKANLDFEYTIDEAAKEWIVSTESRNMKSSIVMFKVKKNTQIDKREGKIYFVAGNLKETFTVYQEGEVPRLVLNKKEYIIDCTEQNIQIELESNIPDYKMIMPNVDWLSENSSRDMSTYTRNISVGENNTGNQRSAIIQFICGEKIDSVMIIQKQKDVIALLSNDTCRIEAKGGPLCFDVSSNVNFTVKLSEPWILQSRHSRIMEEKRLCFQVENNTSLEERKAEIILEGGQAKQTVIVIQKGQSEEGGISILNALNTFDQSAGEQELKIKALGKWNVKVDQSWCVVTPDEGTSGEYSLKVSVIENDTYDERNTVISLFSGTAEERVTVVQKQKDALLLTSEKEEIGSEGGDVFVRTKSNIDYIYKIANEASSWIVPAEGRGLQEATHCFKVSENTSTKSREGKITFVTDKGISEVFTIYQSQGEEPQLILSQHEYVLGSLETELQIQLQYNTKYQMEMPNVDWIHEKVSKSMSTYTHYILVDANTTTDERSAQIKFNYSGKTEIVSITQKAKDALIVAADTIAVEAAGGPVKFDIQTNAEISVKSSVDWIKRVTKTRSLRTETLDFVIQENLVAKERIGDIVISAGSQNQVVKIVQKAFVVVDDLDILNNLATYPSEGSSQTLKIKSSGDWSIESEQSWCQVSPSSGIAGVHDITVRVDGNTTYDERNSALILKVGTVEKRITVTQKQLNGLFLESSKAEVQSNGQDVTVNLSSNIGCTYTIASDATDWIIPLDSRGLVTSAYRFQIKPNPRISSREATIEFKGGGLTEVFTVYQEGETPQLVLTQKEYNLESAGGEVKIELQSNSDYEMVVPSVGWLHERPTRTMSSYTRYITVDENVTTDDRNAQIEFRYAGKTEVVTINQKAKSTLILKQQEYAVESVGGNLDIDFESNATYEITTSVNWIKKAKGTRALTSKTASFTVDTNLDIEPRTGEIIFRNGTDEQKVIVTQKGKKIEGKFVMKHSNIKCHIPVFSVMGSIPKGTINWGDSSTSEYSNGITHEYSNPGTYEVVIQLDKATKVEMQDIEGIEFIDFSSF